MERPDEHIDHLLDSAAAEQRGPPPAAAVGDGGPVPHLDVVHETPRSASRGTTSFTAHLSDSLSPAYIFNLPEAEGAQAKDPLFAYTPSKDCVGPLNLESRLSPNTPTNQFRFSTPTNASAPPHSANKESHPVGAAILGADAQGTNHPQPHQHPAQVKVHQHVVHHQGQGHPPMQHHPHTGYQHGPQHPQHPQPQHYNHMQVHNATQMAQMGIAQMQVMQNSQAHRPPAVFHERKPNPDMVGMTAAHPQHAPHVAQQAAYHSNNYTHQQMASVNHGQYYMPSQGQMALMPAVTSMPQGSQLPNGLPPQHPGTAVSHVGDVQAITAMHPTRQQEEKKAAAAASKRSRSKAANKQQLKRVSTEEAVRLAATMDRPPTRKSSKGGWTPDEDDMLRVVVMENNERNWKNIAKALNESFPGSTRNDVQCLHRWQKVLQPGLKKGPWTADEDATIAELVAKLGANKWSTIARELPGRIGKQCRERWFNHLHPSIKKEPWTKEEEDKLVELHAKYGNKWACISRELPGRTDNAIKNHYNATQRRAQNRKAGRKAKRRQNDDASRSSAGEPPSKGASGGGAGPSNVVAPLDVSMTSASGTASANSSQSSVGNTVAAIAPLQKRKATGAPQPHDDLDISTAVAQVAGSMAQQHLPPSKRHKAAPAPAQHPDEGNTLGEALPGMLHALGGEHDMDKENGGLLHGELSAPLGLSTTPLRERSMNVGDDVGVPPPLGKLSFATPRGTTVRKPRFGSADHFDLMGSPRVPFGAYSTPPRAGSASAAAGSSAPRPMGLGMTLTPLNTKSPTSMFLNMSPPAGAGFRGTPFAGSASAGRKEALSRLPPIFPSPGAMDGGPMDIGLTPPHANRQLLWPGSTPNARSGSGATPGRVDMETVFGASGGRPEK